MIEFRSPSKFVQFLDENLPPKIKEELFYDVSSREYRGKTVINKSKKSDFFIFDELRSINFATGITTDPKSTYIPKKFRVNPNTSDMTSILSKLLERMVLWKNENFQILVKKAVLRT